MARVKLTETYLRKLRPGKERHWDLETPGLYALGGANGATFYCKSTAGEFKIGRASQWTLVEARERAREIRQAADRGEDPRRVKLPTLREAFAIFETVRLAKRRPRTASEYRRQLEKYLFPRWGDRPIDRLARADVVKLHADLTSAGKAVRANRLVATVSSLYGWLRRDGGHMVDNPAAGIERNQEHSREVYLDPAQVALLREALAIYSTRRRGADAVADCIEFTLATGCRSGEAMTATWSQFDQALTTWTKPASTTKQKKLHRVPLGPAAQSILLRRRGLRQEGAEWVFPGRGGIGHARSLHNAWATVCGLAGLRSVRLHDLRHSYASLAISAGVPLQVVGGLLGHSSQQTTRRYAHLFDDDLRTAAGKVNAMIEGGGK